MWGKFGAWPGTLLATNVIVMELTDRQKRFLVAALDAAWKENKAFNVRQVGAGLKFGEEESREIARILEKQNVLSRLANGVAVMTLTGRQRGSESDIVA